MRVAVIVFGMLVTTSCTRSLPPEPPITVTESRHVPGTPYRAFQNLKDINE